MTPSGRHQDARIDSTVSRTLRILFPLVALAASILPAVLHGDEAWMLQTIDPKKIVTAEKCGACHVAAFAVWKKTTHATGFSTLHRKSSAEEIAARMGFPLIKRNSLCLECHYTPEENAGGVVKATEGVSCERCHGAARDWIKIHNKYGEGATYLTETPEHKSERIEQSRAAGMFRPSTIYKVVQNCYRCHTVPNESLVNKGKHGSGSDLILLAGFEKIRHNFLQSLREGDGKKEHELTAAEKRILWVVGWGLDLEYSFRGMANATENGVFLNAMVRRARNARERLEDIRTVITIPQVDSMLAISASVPAAPQRGAEQLRAAERIGDKNRRFIASYDGTSLAPLDTLISGWRPPATVVEEPGPDSLDSGVNPSEVTIQGTAVAHVHDAPGRSSIGATACSKCHGEQGGWWFTDAHARAFDRLKTQGARQIASFYGLSASERTSTERLCLDCHAGRGAYSVRDGVSCEACHGPGKDYDKPHQEGDKALGLERPGFKKSLALGLVDLRHAETLAGACAQCHYITQDRLLSAGHTSGVQFDLAAGHRKIKHWKRSISSDEQVAAAYGQEIKRRGPLPNVVVAQLAEKGEGTDGPDHDSSGSDDGFSFAPSIQLDPFPDIPANATIDEIMVILRNRLKALNRAKAGP